MLGAICNTQILKTYLPKITQTLKKKFNTVRQEKISGKSRV